MTLVEVDGDALGGVVGIEEDVEACGFADGLIDDLDVFDHVNCGDGVVETWLELDGTGDGADVGENLVLPSHLLGRWRGSAGRGRGLLLLLNEIELLLRGLIAGIDFERAGELGLSAGEIATLAEDAAAIDVADGGLEAHAIEMSLVAEIVWSFLNCVLVSLVGGVEVLTCFCGLSTFVPALGRSFGCPGFFGGLGMRGEGAGDGEATEEQEGDRSARSKKRKECR